MEKYFQRLMLLWCVLPAVAVAQNNFDFYISNKGNDNNPGTSLLLPKRTMAAVAPLLKIVSNQRGSVRVGLKSGDKWEENLVTSYPIELNTYNDDAGSGDFAVLNGSKEFSSGWIKEAGTRFTYRQAIPYTGFFGYGINGIGSYSFIYVIEIDRALESTAPFTARKLLKFVGEPGLLETTPGSFYTAINTEENPIPVYIHTSDGNSPNSNGRYRYEVTVRDWAVNSTYQDNNRFENLWVRGFGAGNGMLPGGSNSYYNKVIFGPGASIHHVVVRGGTIDHSLFLPAAKNTNGYALVFYDTEGMRRHCTVKNSMFIDVRLPVYAHTSLGVNYGAVEVDNVIAFADSSETSGFMYTSNTDSVLLNKVYTDGHTTGYYYGNAPYARITNCWFKDAAYGIAYAGGNPVVSVVDNVFIKTKGSSFSPGIVMQENTSLAITNSILHIANTQRSAAGSTTGAFVSGSAGIGRIRASGNIFICDIDPSGSLAAATTNINGGFATSADRWNNNVYVLLRGKKIYWSATTAATDGGFTEINSFEEWKKISGQDQNSLFFDLRHDSRGLKAIFADPANGNYELADTREGRMIAALNAGMSQPLTCFIQKPSYEQAAAFIRTASLPTVSSCRNPCYRNDIRVSSAFDVGSVNRQQVKLNWNIAEQQNIDHFELQRSSQYALFSRISTIPVTEDSMYVFTDHVPAGNEYQYRLVVVSKSGNKCFSDIRTVEIKEARSFSVYPNPSAGKILVSSNGYTGQGRITILNAVGQPMLEKTFISLAASIPLDLHFLPAGTYIIKMQTAAGIGLQKFALGK
jgi:hypothetical protein